MHAILNRVSPSATDMIRADHTRVMAAFHRYGLDSSPRAKRRIVNAICLALEVHAQIEEEIFYPALRAADNTLIDEQLVPEHDEIRKLIGALRAMDPASDQYDITFMELMRIVVHHAADEETIVLPHAESVLADSLPMLGRQMAKRRLQLKAPYVAKSPSAWLVAAGALAAGAYVYRNAGRREAA
jgi:hemerythrin superfamily protein